MSRRALLSVMPWLVIVAFFLLWEFFCVLLAIPSFVLPRPSLIAATALQFQSQILHHSAQTLFTTVIGFFAALVGGLLLGLLIGASSLIYRSLYPVLIAFNSVPKVALIPVLVIWCGIGTVPAIITSFAIAFFPIAVNVATGLATIEPEMEDVLRSLGASRLAVLTKAGVPRSMPYLFASLKVAISLAFIGSIVSETVASNNGIGYLMVSASSSLNVPLVFAGLIAVAFMGVTLYWICSVIEQRMTRWAFRTQELVT